MVLPWDRHCCANAHPPPPGARAQLHLFPLGPICPSATVVWDKHIWASGFIQSQGSSVPEEVNFVGLAGYRMSTRQSISFLQLSFPDLARWCLQFDSNSGSRSLVQVLRPT